MEDISLRALRVFKEADVILAEDTRHTGLLLHHFEIEHKPMLSLYDEVESKKLADLVSLASSEQKIVLVSDAGTPLISDPGYKLVRDCIFAGVKVESVPGPSAPITALTLSGLPPDKFMFLGYPPEKASHQKNILENIMAISKIVKCTYIFFISPHKLIKDLRIFLEILGDIDIVICREMTKIHQEVWRGKISEALSHFANPRGEIVLVFNI